MYIFAFSHPRVSEQLRDWEMEIGQDMVKVAGRHVPEEKVYMENKQLRQNNAEWSRDMRGRKLDVPVEIGDWIIVHPTRKGFSRVIDKFINDVEKVSRDLGIYIQRPLRYV